MAVEWSFTPAKIDASVVITARASVAVGDAARLIAAKSLPLVPVDTGALRDSQQVTQDGLEAAISYDVLNAEDGYPYGIRQHEDLQLHHPNGGQAKFLEQPFREEAPRALDIIATALREAIGE